ncbi:MAG: pilus assembly protein [Parvularculaceae bacterium]|nr:pilus assembly protein [Parvularculaceae bacterium]
MKNRALGLSRLVGDRRGATAIEFAIVAPVFLALTFSILEAGYFFFVSSAVDQAAARAARLIRTGQAQSVASPITREEFFDRVCEVVDLFGNCDTQLTVDVARYTSFAQLAADASAPTCRDADDDAINAIPYAPGAEREIVRVRICYLHKSFNPALGLNLSQAADGSRKMISVTIFRNEPFNS